MDITGHPDGPPMRTGIAMTDYLAALYAYSGILLALRERDRTGKGQHVDISLFDSILSTLSMPVGILQATGRKPRRARQRPLGDRAVRSAARVPMAA